MRTAAPAATEASRSRSSPGQQRDDEHRLGCDEQGEAGGEQPPPRCPEQEEPAAGGSDQRGHFGERLVGHGGDEA